LPIAAIGAAAAHRQHRGRRVVAYQQIRSVQFEQPAPGRQQSGQPARVQPSGGGQHRRIIDQLGRVHHARQPQRRLQHRETVGNDAAVRARQILQRKGDRMSTFAQRARGDQHAIDVAHVGAQLPSHQYAAHCIHTCRAALHNALFRRKDDTQIIDS